MSGAHGPEGARRPPGRGAPPPRREDQLASDVDFAKALYCGFDRHARIPEKTVAAGTRARPKDTAAVLHRIVVHSCRQAGAVANPARDKIAHPDAEATAVTP